MENLGDPNITWAGDVDDAMFAVASPTIEENVRKFDIGKCLLVHFTRNQRKCTPTPMHVAGQTVEAVDSAKYLGMILDRRLRFHEQVEAAVAKGTAATMAIARLTRPTLGLPHKHERQLYRAVVIPKVEYAAPVWYNPIRPRDTGKGRKGSVGFARQIGRVQRLAARLICGGFRTTAADFLSYHADLLYPSKSASITQSSNSALRLATLPSHHPLYSLFRNCRRYVHELRDAFATYVPAQHRDHRRDADRPDLESGLHHTHCAQQGRRSCGVTYNASCRARAYIRMARGTREA